MEALLVRVGIDASYGHWNAPVDPDTGEFVYVPIPDNVAFQPGMATPYRALQGALRAFAAGRPEADGRKLALPAALEPQHMHLDPDFARLTYGDVGARRGKRIAGLGAGDLLVFYAGLRPCRPSAHRLVYAIVGLYRVAEVVRVEEVSPERWADNAHTRRLEHRSGDIVVRAQPGRSGRLRRCLPIGELRGGVYRVRHELLAAWGDLSCKDGYLQRSAVPPRFRDPARFLAWFEAQAPEMVAANNPHEQEPP